MQKRNSDKKLRRQKINLMLNEDERKLITEKAISYGYGDCLAEYIRAAAIYENIWVEDVVGKNEVCEAVSKCIEVLRELLNEQKKLLMNPGISSQNIKKIIDQNKKIIEEVDSLQKTVITNLSVNTEKKIQHRAKMIDNHRTDVKLLKRVTEYDKKITILRPSNLKSPVQKYGYVVYLKMYEYDFEINNMKAEDFIGLVNLLRDVAMKKNLLLCFYSWDKNLKFGIVMPFERYEDAQKYAIKEKQKVYSITIKDIGLVGDISANNS